MKYWYESDIEYLEYSEGKRILPYKHPASIVKAENFYMEIEIVPNTTEDARTFINPDTFEEDYLRLVLIERRVYRKNQDVYEEQFYVPLEYLGYEEEPVSNKKFDESFKNLT